MDGRQNEWHYVWFRQDYEAKSFSYRLLDDDAEAERIERLKRKAGAAEKRDDKRTRVQKEKVRLGEKGTRQQQENLF